MLTRGAALKTALIGAGLGVLVFAVILVFASHWYASPAGLLVLILSPGVFVEALKPQSTALYFGLAFAVQAFTYAIVALAIRAVFHFAAHRGRDAV